ncbi:FlaD/FlaE family flagellar protein [Natronococcus sp. A-GB1]|uniref:FlaD/FlaE family flagellar protein n=1 Tax=Natronococcus sp. A-GB1 TaxID=3037648 RepID=UPI00241E5ED6|nr:FlaD/FlaE family flagellar protein [Natronococcus sp. A-GB1]MDG5758817.1 FlaD/FlaE family flagellar protein [Natronococcus sp. A-GB1]
MTDTTPYLETLDGPTDRTDVTIDWVRYLTDRFGTTGALNCLRYYEELGWIGPRAREQLVAYVRGVSRDATDHPDDDLASPIDSLEGSAFAAHARSLAYVARINGESLADDVLVGRMADQRTDRQFDDRSADVGDVVGAVDK